jgi:hypothetical protein
VDHDRLALWHFTVFVPDRFWGGIVGAFLGALIGSFLFGLIITGCPSPGRDGHGPRDGARGVPGSLLGMALVYFLGVRREAQQA